MKDNQTYRRAYRLGWRTCIDTLNGLLWYQGKTGEEASTILEEHWKTTLAEWEALPLEHSIRPPTLNEDVQDLLK